MDDRRLNFIYYQRIQIPVVKLLVEKWHSSSSSERELIIFLESCIYAVETVYIIQGPCSSRDLGIFFDTLATFPSCFNFGTPTSFDAYCDLNTNFKIIKVIFDKTRHSHERGDCHYPSYWRYLYEWQICCIPGERSISWTIVLAQK